MSVAECDVFCPFWPFWNKDTKILSIFDDFGQISVGFLAFLTIFVEYFCILCLFWWFGLSDSLSIGSGERIARENCIFLVIVKEYILQ